jgi:hypothetical protein
VEQSQWEDDWINEGLAEYSAFSGIRKFIGTEFANLLLMNIKPPSKTAPPNFQYWKPPAIRGKPHQPVLQTHRFAKLAATEIRRRKNGEFIASLDAAFIQNLGGTTRLFFANPRRKVGKEAFDFFTEGLNRKNWNKRSEAVGAGYDADFGRTWTGGLTQFGTTSKLCFT